jgi:hypothetical protein
MVYKRSEIIKLINFNEFTLADFYYFCPYDFNQKENQTRKREVVMWRNVGMVWAWLSGFTMENAGKLFNRDHSTVIHALGQLMLTYEGYGYEEIKQNIETIKNGLKEVVIIHDDICVNYAVSQVLLEKKLAEMLSK